MVVDTFHLFDETMPFLRSLEDHYGFKAEVFCAEGVPVGDKVRMDEERRKGGAKRQQNNYTKYPHN